MRWYATAIFIFAIAAFIVLLPRTTFAATTDCSFTSTPSVLFGTFDVFGPAVSTTGTIAGICNTGSNTLRPVITMSKGGSTTYHPRKMACISGACLTNGDSADVVVYNLYTTASHATIWGDPTVDATTGSVTLASGCCKSGVAWSTTIYGFMPAAIAGGNNDVSVGGYQDTVVMTMTF